MSFLPSISVIDGKITIAYSYALVADDDKEYDSKRSQINDDELTTGEKTYIEKISTALIKKIKIKEDI